MKLVPGSYKVLHRTQNILSRNVENGENSKMIATSLLAVADLVRISNVTSLRHVVNEIICCESGVGLYNYRVFQTCDSILKFNHRLDINVIERRKF